MGWGGVRKLGADIHLMVANVGIATHFLTHFGFGVSGHPSMMTLVLNCFLSVPLPASFFIRLLGCGWRFHYLLDVHQQLPRVSQPSATTCEWMAFGAATKPSVNM